MADRETMLQILEDMYESGDYEMLVNQMTKFLNDMETQVEMRQNPEFNKRVRILHVKEYLAVLHAGTMDETAYNNVMDGIMRATEKVSSLQEYYEIEHEIDKAKNLWKKNSTEAGLNELINNPKLDQWREYLELCTEIAGGILQFSVAMAANGKKKALLEAEGLTADEAKEKYGIPLEDKFSEDDKENMEFDAACRIFDNAQAYIDNWRDASVEAVQAATKNMFDMLTLVDLVMSYTIPDDDKKLKPSPHYARLGVYAMVLEYMLELVVYPNGRSMSLYDGKMRQDTRNALDEVNRRIRLLDKDFIPKDLPPVTGLKIESNDPSYEADRRKEREAEEQVINKVKKDSNDDNIREAIREFREGNPFTAKCRFHVAMHKMPDEPIGYIGKALAKRKFDGSDYKELVKAAGKCQSGSKYDKVLKEFLEYEVGPYGQTMLLSAMINGYYGVAEALIKLGANVNCANAEGITPLWCAASGDTAIVKELSEKDKAELKKLAVMLLEKGAAVDAVHSKTGVAAYNSSTDPEVAALIREKYPDAQMGQSKAELAAAKAEKRSKGAKKALIIIIAAVVLIAGAAIGIGRMQKEKDYKAGIQYLEEGDYTGAYDAFYYLNGYKDAEKYLLVSEAYEYFTMKNEYGRPYGMVKDLGDFEPAQKLMKEIEEAAIPYLEKYISKTKKEKTDEYFDILHANRQLYPQLTGEEIEQVMAGNWYEPDVYPNQGYYYTLKTDGSAESVYLDTKPEKAVEDIDKDASWRIEENHFVYDNVYEIDEYEITDMDGILILNDVEYADSGALWLEHDKTVDEIAKKYK